MDYSLTTAGVENAILRFYSTADEGAHRWLLRIQTTREAWTFLWELLDPSKKSEVQFCAANMLYTKITENWQDIQEFEYPALRNRILQYLERPLSEVVVSRLCQCLSAFLVNCSTSNDTNKGMVDGLLEDLPYNTPNTIPLLLRVLEVIPGEFDKKHSSNRIKMIHLVENCPKMIWLIQQVLSSSDQLLETNGKKSNYLLALECGLSWLKVGRLPLDNLGQVFQDFLRATTYYLPKGNDEEMETNRGWYVAQECVTLMLISPELRQRPQLLWQWSKDIIQIAQENGCKHYYEILTTLGEGHSREFLSALIGNNEEIKWISHKLIDFLLQCSEEPGRYPTDERRSCIPFGFWYSLQDDVLSLDTPFENQAVYALKPIYARLAHALLRKAALPATPSQAGNADDAELFRCYRQDAADTLMFCYNILGTDLLLLLGQRLTQLHTHVQCWTEVESTIHAIKALSESVGYQETQYVPATMDLVLSHIPYGHYPKEVLSSTCLMIGAYAEWIGEHPQPWLERALEVVTLGLTQGPATALAASMALKDLTRECEAFMGPLAPPILKTIGQTLPNVTPGGREGLRLMYTAGKLFNCVSPNLTEKMTHLETILGPCMVELQDKLRYPVKEAQLSVSNQLKMIMTLLSTLKGAIAYSVLEGLLPIFEKIVNHPEWSTDDVTLEAMHTCAQKSLLNVERSEIQTKSLLTMLSISYKTKPHPAALNLLKQILHLWGNSWHSMVTPVLNEVNELTLNGISTFHSAGGNLSDLSDLLEAYLELLATLCKRYIKMLMEVPEHIPQMLHYGIKCLWLPETATRRAAGNFLAQAIMKSHLKNYIEQVGAELMDTIILSLGGVIPRNNLEPHAGVLFALRMTYPEWTAVWMRDSLSLPVSLPASKVQKNFFISDVLRERTSKCRLFEKLKDFSLQIRQNSGVDLESSVRTLENDIGQMCIPE